MVYRSHCLTKWLLKHGHIVTFLYFLASTNISYSQEVPSFFSLSFVTGYGGYAMPDLKRINTTVSQSLPFKAADVNSFDPGLYFSISVNYQKDLLYVSLGYQNYTTGSRIGLKDYSGIYTFDQIVGGHLAFFQPGIIFGNKSLSAMPSLPMGLMISTLRLDENLKVGEFERQDELKMTAKSLVFVPSLNVNISVLPFLGLTCAAGWMIDNGGKFHIKKHKEASLNIGGQVKSGWQGLRLSFGITLKIAHKNTTVKEFRQSDYFDVY
ncbi:MAG TPA: hypothetical protein VHO46_12720 [Bacteroidales bacterium]|nr:hypothetical protein [Bacteroidales bacterium]